jgi:glycosyltransferase involved in cell wall biosynthesis
MVTGRVPDVRPYIAHANVVVAPLRIGRGIQNKVLEGMAMAKPVVASSVALAGTNAVVGAEVLVADNPTDFAEAICQALNSEVGTMLGRSARRRVLADFAWSASLNRLGSILGAHVNAPETR